MISDNYEDDDKTVEVVTMQTVVAVSMMIRIRMMIRVVVRMMLMNPMRG